MYLKYNLNTLQVIKKKNVFKKLLSFDCMDLNIFLYIYIKNTLYYVHYSLNNLALHQSSILSNPVYFLTIVLIIQLN